MSVPKNESWSQRKPLNDCSRETGEGFSKQPLKLDHRKYWGKSVDIGQN